MRGKVRHAQRNAHRRAVQEIMSMGQVTYRQVTRAYH